MKSLDAQSAVTAGGWDSRYAVAVAVATHQDIAAALIDTNGDEADIDLDRYERDTDGHWRESVSDSAGGSGTSWSRRIVATWGRSTPHEIVDITYLGDRYSVTASDGGWWLFIAPATDDSKEVQRQLGKGLL